MVKDTRSSKIISFGFARGWAIEHSAAGFLTQLCFFVVGCPVQLVRLQHLNAWDAKMQCVQDEPLSKLLRGAI